MARGFIEDAIKQGDLAPSTPVPSVMFAIMAMAIGTHTITSNFRPLLAQTGVLNPFSALRDSVEVLLDGFGWRPLSSEWDYAGTYHRLAQEVFADEFQSAGLD
jgi:hypothetical protein